MAKSKTKTTDERQVALINQLHDDARIMAEEAGIHQCQFSAATAYLCLAEMVVNGHEACAMRLIAKFFKDLADGTVETTVPRRD
jgi:hypothetical protein